MVIGGAPNEDCAHILGIGLDRSLRSIGRRSSLRMRSAFAGIQPTCAGTKKASNRRNRSLLFTTFRSVIFSDRCTPAVQPVTQTDRCAAGPRINSGLGSAVPPLPSNVSLVGVIIDGDRQLALIKTQGAPFAESLRVGAVIDGWKVTEIAPDKVVLRAGTAEQILGIGDQRSNQQQTARPPSINGAGIPQQSTPRPPLKQSIPSNGAGPAIGNSSP